MSTFGPKSGPPKQQRLPQGSHRPRSAPSTRKGNPGGALDRVGLTDTRPNDLGVGGGVRGARQLRRQRSDTQKENTPPGNGSGVRGGAMGPDRKRPASASGRRGNSSSGRNRIEAARNYLSDHVDPLMSEIINFLLLEQPADAENTILAFLEARRAGERLRPTPGPPNRQAVLRDRLYMARKVQPILEQLIHRVVDEQPRDVESHFIEQLKSMQGHGTAGVVVTGSELTRQACDALFRMIDENSKGLLALSAIQQGVNKLHACGVPIDAKAHGFWTTCVLDIEGEVEKGEFYDVMSRVCELWTAGGQSSIEGLPVSSAVKPTVEECKAIFSQLDETNLGALPVTVITERLDALVSRGVPVRDTLRKRWAMSCAQNPPLPTYAGLEPKFNALDFHGLLSSPSLGTTCSTSAVAAAAMPAPSPAKAATPAPENVPEVQPTPAPTNNLKAGLAVDVDYKKSGNIYPGKIAKVLSTGNCDIDYDDGDKEANVPPERIIVKDVPELAVGVKVKVNYKKSGNWYEGKIHQMHANGKFDIHYDDGDFEGGVEAARMHVLTPEGEIPATTLSLPAAVAEPEVVQEQALPPPDEPLNFDEPLIFNVGVFGFSGAGKSTILQALDGKAVPEKGPAKTMGAVAGQDLFLGDNQEIKITFFDTSGTLRKNWKDKAGSVHAALFVVDAGANEKAFDKTLRAFRELEALESDFGGHAQLQPLVNGKPMLVLANKADSETARSEAELIDALGLASRPATKLMSCVGHPLKFAATGADEPMDPRIEQALGWLASAVKNEIPFLKSVVDAANVAREKQLQDEKAKKKKDVLRSILSEKAFPADGQTEECYTGEGGVEGENFLQDELFGYTIDGVLVPREQLEPLPELAKEVCKLVNYHKVALITIGGFVKPPNKKEEAMTWQEVHDYVVERRKEAGVTAVGVYPQP